MFLFILGGSIVLIPLAALAAWFRFLYLRPSPVTFRDTRSAELWRHLSKRRPLLLFTDSLFDSAQRHLFGTGETLEADAPRVLVHFGQDVRAAVPAVWLHEAGAGFLMKVWYRHKLAEVVLAVLKGLQPACALSIHPPRRPDHAGLLWLRLLVKLDGPEWFVLSSLAARAAYVKPFHRARQIAHAETGKHAHT